MSRIYAAGAAMGWSVFEVKATSMWEFWAAWLGFIRANTPETSASLSRQDKEELLDWISSEQEQSGQIETMTYHWDGLRFVPDGFVVVSG